MAQGTIQGKDRFLNNIANALGRKRITEPVVIPEWSKEPHREVFKGLDQNELLDQFIIQSDKIHTSVVVTKFDDLNQSFGEVVEQMGKDSIVYSKDSRFEEFGLTTYLDQVKSAGTDVFEWDSTNPKKSIVKAEKANIGVTFSDVTLAESGTVVLFSDNGKGRSVSLLPQRYIAIVPKSTLVPRMTQASDRISEMAKENGRMPSCINFISGPSNSADIELRLVVGVHGPVQATYIVIDDK